jgi:hypothetical protein
VGDSLHLIRYAWLFRRQRRTRPLSAYHLTSVRNELSLPGDQDSIGAKPEEFPLILPVVPCLFFLLCLFDSAKGRIWHGLFTGVLLHPFRAQEAYVLFGSVCLFLWLFVRVAVVVAVVAELFYDV